MSLLSRELGPVFVTGSAGFIGFHVSQRLLDLGVDVFGFDNVNDYYDPDLKRARLAILESRAGFQFTRGDLQDEEALRRAYVSAAPRAVVHLAAQAGVRYSLECPGAYVQSNLVGFANLMELCRSAKPTHLVYASSSSVYGANRKQPFSVEDRSDHPISLYAATKRANELMAFTYCHLFGLAATGLRFFTVYGPWGRPDMALFKFTERILANEPIDVFNFGNMKRDFTYIDDIVEGVLRVLAMPPHPIDDPNLASNARHKVYNIGGSNPIELTRFIDVLARALGKQPRMNMLPLQDGDVVETSADVEDLEAAIGFRPQISIEEGIPRFVDWYKSYYGRS